jgi:hypothetical protein
MVQLLHQINLLEPTLAVKVVYGFALARLHHFADHLLVRSCVDRRVHAAKVARAKLVPGDAETKSFLKLLEGLISIMDEKAIVHLS